MEPEAAFERRRKARSRFFEDGDPASATWARRQQRFQRGRSSGPLARAPAEERLAQASRLLACVCCLAGGFRVLCVEHILHRVPILPVTFPPPPSFTCFVSSLGVIVSLRIPRHNTNSNLASRVWCSLRTHLL